MPEQLSSFQMHFVKTPDNRNRPDADLQVNHLSYLESCSPCNRRQKTVPILFIKTAMSPFSEIKKYTFFL